MGFIHDYVREHRSGSSTSHDTNIGAPKALTVNTTALWTSR
jgi:hypothetical protein